MRDLKWPPWLAGGPEVPAEVQEKLLGSLFAPDDALRTGLFLVTLTGLLSAARLWALWPFFWVAAAIPICAYRPWIAHAYRRDSATGTRDAWVRRFALGAWSYASIWGLAGLAIAFIADGFVRMIIVSALVVLVRGFAGRNNASPAITLVQIALALIPAITGCLLSGDPFMAAFTLFLLLQLHAGFGIVTQSSRRTLRLLNAEFTAAGLLSDLKVANAGLARLATTDGLTDLVNRRGFEQALDTEWRRAIREETPLSLLMIDVDCFKRYNDTYGHIAGDACLRQVAGALAAACRRPADVVARYGGEEFAVILPSTASAGARTLAEAARRAVQLLHMPHAGSDHQTVTVTVGCATLYPRQALASSILVRCADAALYEGKHLGRNRVEEATPAALDFLSGTNHEMSG